MMKKSKTLVLMITICLSLSLGACTGEDQSQNVDSLVESTDSSLSETTSSEDDDGDTGSEGDGDDNEGTEDGDDDDNKNQVAYAIVGDFVDSSWNNTPAEDSIYYIPIGTTHYEASVEIDLVGDAGLRVVEYDTWNLVLGYDQLDSNSTGVVGEGQGGSKNILLTEGAKYTLTLYFGKDPSILVALDDTAYAIVGDFPDASWDNLPTRDSLYFIPAGTSHYEVTVKIDTISGDAGLRVVEYGTWNLTLGYDQLDSNSTGIVGEGKAGSKDILLEQDSSYTLVIDLGDNPSILVTINLVTYAIIGNFTDPLWDNTPDEDSLYFIPAETPHYVVTLEIPDLGEITPAFRVVEWGTDDLVVGYENVDLDNSIGVLEGDEDGNILLCESNRSYNLTIEIGDEKDGTETSITITYDYGNPVEDILQGIENGDNFTLSIHDFEEMTSYVTAGETPDPDYTMHNDADITIYYTDELIFYYGNLHNSIDQKDYVAYVNNNDGTMTKYSLTSSAGVINTETMAGPWEEVLNTPRVLPSYSDAFSKGETSIDAEKGPTVEYNIDESFDGLIPMLLDSVFTASNSYYGLFLAGANRVQNLYNNNRTDEYNLSSAYYPNSEKWFINVETSDIYWTSTSAGLSWNEHDLLEAALFDVGQTTIPEEYLTILGL